MSKYLIEDTTLTGIADEVRALSGTTGAMTPSVMKTNLNSANTEVNDQTALIAQIKSAMKNKVGNLIIGDTTGAHVNGRVLML